jgi:hypothetical protein
MSRTEVQKRLSLHAALCYDTSGHIKVVQEKNSMNREDKGKALHICVSQRLPANQAWDSMTEETKEVYRAVGESIAQDFIYGGKYELSLSPLDEDQIIYNGLFPYMHPHGYYGWCHLLLLRSKNRDIENEENVRKMAIVAQTPHNLLAVQREIEYIATHIMEVFKSPRFNHPKDDITIIPENTTFIEYLPYSGLDDIADITQTPESSSEISIVSFKWEETSSRTFRYKASDPAWNDISLATVNKMIQRL